MEAAKTKIDLLEEESVFFKNRHEALNDEYVRLKTQFEDLAQKLAD